MIETSLEHIGFTTRLLYTLFGAIGIFIILIRNNVLVSVNSHLALIKFLIVVSMSHAIFAFIGWSSLYKYFFSGLLLVVFILNIDIKKSHASIIWIFLLLTGLYFSSYVIIGADLADTITIYVTLATPLLLFLILTKTRQTVILLKPLVKDLIVFQIIMSVVKLALIGINEALVGTIGYTNGSVAAIFPLLALIFLWQAGYFKNNQNFIIWIIFLSLVTIASNKRAYWFIMPVVVFYIYYYKDQKIKIRFISVLKYLPLVLFILYVGLRLTATLNPERKFGGYFDRIDAVNYADDYTFAEEQTAKTGIAHGRGAGVLLTIKDIINNFSQKNTLWGNGVDLLHAKSRSEQEFLKEYGFLSKGTMTGFTKIHLTLGLLGVLSYLLYMIGIVRFTKKFSEKHVYRLLLVLVLFEFFFYKGVIFDHWGLTAMLIYIVTFEYNKKFIVNYIK